MTGGYRVRMLGIRVWTAGRRSWQLVADLRQSSPLAVDRKNLVTFSGSYPQALSTGERGLPVENGCRPGCSHVERRKARSRRTRPGCSGSWGLVCTPQENRAGYPSRVCSILGAASTWGPTPGASQGIDRIAEAIDQLETDLRAESSALEMSARVADIWLMVTVLDPELSRLINRYTAPGNPADGTGSLRIGPAEASARRCPHRVADRRGFAFLENQRR